jgi:hypothetical protein
MEKRNDTFKLKGKTDYVSVSNHQLVNLSHALNLEGVVIMNMGIYTG